MYIIFFIISSISLYSVNYVINQFNNNNKILKIKYNNLQNRYKILDDNFNKYKYDTECCEKSFKNRLIALRIEYAKFKINYKQLQQENYNLRDENIELQNDIKNLTNNEF